MKRILPPLVFLLSSLGYAQTAEPGPAPKFSGFLQPRWSLARAEGTGIHQSFDIALARVALNGRIPGSRASYFVQLQASTLGDSNALSLLDGWMDYAFESGVRVQAGRFILPYSRQFYTHPGQLLFSDLSVADYAFNLPRSIGAAVYGGVGRLSYSVAAVNSVRALDGVGQKNSGKGISGVARIELDVLAPYGYLETAPTAPDVPQFSVGAAVATNRVATDSAFQAVRAGEQTVGWTLDSGFRAGRISAQAAYYSRRNRSAGTSDLGYYGQLGAYAIPGLLEIAGRASQVRFGSRSDSAGAVQDSEFVLGLNGYLRGHELKIQADYGVTIQKEAHGAQTRGGLVRIQTQLMF